MAEFTSVTTNTVTIYKADLAPYIVAALKSLNPTAVEFRDNVGAKDGRIGELVIPLSRENIYVALKLLIPDLPTENYKIINQFGQGNLALRVTWTT